MPEDGNLDKITEKIEEWSSAIKENLGEGAEFAWPLYIEYVSATGWASLIVSFFFLLSVGVLVSIGSSLIKKSLKEEYIKSSEDFLIAGGIICIVGFVMSIVFLIWFVNEGGDNFCKIIAPEGYAIRELLDVLR